MQVAREIESCHTHSHSRNLQIAAVNRRLRHSSLVWRSEVNFEFRAWNINELYVVASASIIFIILDCFCTRSVYTHCLLTHFNLEFIVRHSKLDRNFLNSVQNVLWMLMSIEYGKEKNEKAIPLIAKIQVACVLRTTEIHWIIELVDEVHRRHGSVEMQWKST